MWKGFQRFQTDLFRVAALRMTGLALPTEWSSLSRLGNTWLGGVAIRTAGKIVQGFAVDLSLRLITIRSLMEALETLAISDAGEDLQSRSGIAAGFGKDEASLRAHYELIERDALLFHWLGEIPGTPLSASRFQAISKRLLKGVEESRGLRAVRLLSQDPSLCVCLVGVKSRYGCWMIGMGSARKEQDALEKALYEFLAAVWSHRQGESCYVESIKDQNSKRYQLARHHASTREPEKSALLDRILTPMEGTQALELENQLGGDLRNAIRPETSRFRELPSRSGKYFVVQAQNPALLPLHFSDRFLENYEAYRENPRLNRLLEVRERKFHPPQGFLLHPLD